MTDIVERIARAIDSGDHDRAAGGIRELLASSARWRPAEHELISRWVRALEDPPTHRRPVPGERHDHAGAFSALIEPSESALPGFDVIGAEPPFLYRLPQGTQLHRPGIRVAILEDATVVRLAGTFLVKDAHGVIVHEASGHGSGPLDELYEVAVTSKPMTSVEGRGLLMLDGADGANFCHWMSDHVTRLAVYANAGSVPGVLLVDSLARPFHGQTLDALADLHEGAIDMRAAPVVRARELVVASNVGVDFQHPAHRAADWATDFLVARLAADAPATHDGSIYVSRADAARRRVVGEEAVIDTLRQRGFEIISLTGMHVLDQARLFRSASRIISAHGAGLTNLVFSRPGTHVLELFPHSYGTPTFAIIASTGGMRYTAMMCEPVPGEPGRPNTDDLIVEASEVARWADQ